MEPITTLTPNDILLGKGSGVTEYIGNQRFLALVEERKGAYNSASKNKEKARLAKEFLEHVHSLGGRFLKREGGRTEQGEQQLSNVVENSVWHEVDEKTALDKIKQAFRQNRDYKRFNRKSLNAATGSGDQVSDLTREDAPSDGNVNHGPSSLAADATQEDTDGRTVSTSSRIPANDSSNLFPLISLGSGAYPMVNYSNLFPTNGSHPTVAPPFGGTCSTAKDSPDQTPLLQNAMSIFSGLLPPELYSRYFADIILGLQMPSSQVSSTTVLPDRKAKSAQTHENSVQRDPTLKHNLASSVGASATPPLAKDEASDALLALSLADRPKITDEQLQQEKSALTYEEQEGLLADLFGKQCTVESHRRKKAKRDFEDNETTAFLLQQMRTELDSIPDRNKQALVDAKTQTKCCQEEFGDSRLKQFLRADGMNPKLAAERFVNYWESRRELFGQEKFFLRMTLSEALSDDVAAINSGGWTILPHRDLSGRPLIFIEPPRIMRDGCTSESMIRAAWYLAEIMVREYAEPDGNFIWIIWDKDSSLWHYDRLFITRVPYYHRHCWPMREMPTHSCCSNAFMRRVVKPVLIATMGKAGRCRVMIHDAPASEILDTLADYGILKGMCPECMGGDVDLDAWLSEFVAQRRAIEMEEL